MRKDDTVQFKKTVAATVAAATLALAGCSGASGGADSAGSGSDSTLTLGALLPPTSQSTVDIGWANTSIYAQAVYDTLVRETPDAKVRPWLATSWSYDKTKTTLTMKLRKDVVFTDGTAFTADVAAQNILRFRDSAASAAADLARVKDAKAVGRTTLRVTLKEPDPALLTVLTQSAGLQASPKSFDAADAKTKPVGSGPYVLDGDQTVIGSKYVYEKNDDYWAPHEQHYDNVVVNVYQNAAAITGAIQGGQVDGTLLVPDVAEQASRAGFKLYGIEQGFTGMLLLDRGGDLSEPLANVDVRRAFNYAFDRKKLMQVIADGKGTTTTQIFAPGSDAYDPSLDQKYPYDPAKAKQLLADAGYPDGFTIELPQIQGIPVAVYDVCKQYLDAVGIKVTYKLVAGNDAIPSVVGGKFPAALFILGFLATPFQTANFAVSKDAVFNVFHTEDARVADLVKQMQTGSSAAAGKAGKSLSAYLVDQAWFAPFFRNGSPQFAADKDVAVTLQSDNPYPYLWNLAPKS